MSLCLLTGLVSPSSTTFSKSSGLQIYLPCSCLSIIRQTIQSACMLSFFHARRLTSKSTYASDLEVRDPNLRSTEGLQLCGPATQWKTGRTTKMGKIWKICPDQNWEKMEKMENWPDFPFFGIFGHFFPTFARGKFSMFSHFFPFLPFGPFSIV